MAGYINVTQLSGVRPPSGLPDARAAFEAYARLYVRRMGSTDTIFALKIFLNRGVPSVGQDSDLVAVDLSTSAARVYNHTAGAAPGFHVFRIVLAQPGFTSDLTQRLFVDHPDRKLAQAHSASSPAQAHRGGPGRVFRAALLPSRSPAELPLHDHGGKHLAHRGDGHVASDFVYRAQ